MVIASVLLNFQAEMLERFGNAGLVFLVMAIVIYFMFKEYKQEKKEKTEIQAQFNDYLKNKQADQIEIINDFGNTLENMNQQISEIKQKLNK
jgi:hypothetical protein